MKPNQNNEDGVARLRNLSSSESHAAQRNIDHELAVLISFLEPMPTSIKRQFIPYFDLLKKNLKSQILLQSFLETLPPLNPSRKNRASAQVKNIVNICEKLFQLSILSDAFQKMEDRFAKMPISKDAKTQKTEFEKIDLISKNYDTYYRISKHFYDHPLPQCDKKARQSKFYEPPRFITRVQELSHYRANMESHGNILYLHYEGHMIKGRNTYAVLNDNKIQIWQKTTKFNDLLPNEEENQVKNDSKNDSKNDNKSDSKNQPKEKTKTNKVNQDKFKLFFQIPAHTSKITAASFSKDELYLITGSLDRTIHLWCLRMRTLLTEYKGHMGTIWDLDFSPCQYYFLSGSSDGTMILWKTNYPLARRIFPHGGDVYKVAFASNNDYVISAGQNCMVKIWKIEKAECLLQFDFSKPIYNFTSNFSGEYLAVCEVDGTLTILNLYKGHRVNRFHISDQSQEEQSEGKTLRKKRIHDLCFSDDDRDFVCVSERHIFWYSMESIEGGVSSNIISIYERESNDPSTSNSSKIIPKEVIYMGRDINLTFCKYQDKGLLVVAGTKKTA